MEAVEIRGKTHRCWGEGPTCFGGCVGGTDPPPNLRFVRDTTSLPSSTEGTSGGWKGGRVVLCLFSIGIAGFSRAVHPERVLPPRSMKAPGPLAPPPGQCGQA